jgi:6-bladed beta-propeller protein
MHPRFKCSIPSLFFILLTGCGGVQATKLAQARIDTLPNGTVRVMSEGPTAWSDSAGASLVEAARFEGEDGTAAELGQPQSIAVDAEGRIYVVDSKPAVIKVFSPSGELIRTIGREGEGPGEFRVGFIAVRGEHLVLHDPALSRTSVFDTAGNLLRSWHSACCYRGDIQVDSRNRIYIAGSGDPKENGPAGRTSWVRWSLDGAILDTLWIPNRESGKTWTVRFGPGGKAAMTTGVPFMPLRIHTLHPDGGLVYGWTGEYAIVRSGTGRDSIRVFGRTWTPEAITDERRKAEVELMIQQMAGMAPIGMSDLKQAARDAFRVEDVPTTLPAYQNLRVDPSGRVWVRRHAIADTSRTFYDLFDSTGAYLGPVTAPFRVDRWGKQAWTRDELVAVIEDEGGRPTVVRLRLEVPGRAK